MLFNKIQYIYKTVCLCIYDLNLCLKTWKNCKDMQSKGNICLQLTTYFTIITNDILHPNPAFILTPQCAGTRPWQKIQVTPIWQHVRAGAKGTTLENASLRFEKQKQEVMQGVDRSSTSSNRSLVTRVSESRWLCQLSLTSFLAPSNSQEQYRELKINHCTTVT